MLYLVPSLMLCVFSMFCTLLIRPFSARAFRSANRFLADTWLRSATGWVARLYGTRLEVSGDPMPEGENVILIANHQTGADIPLLFALAGLEKRCGDLKWFAKESVRYIPLAGWGMHFLDCVFVKRNWMADRQNIEQVFDKIVRYRVPMWLISFVEGTRLTPEKLARSRAFALRRDLPPPEHVMVPHTKGFHATILGLRSHADAVYDVTIGYVGGIPSFWQWYKGQARRVCLHVRRFPLATLPTELDDLADWLLARFREKDALLDHYYTSGAFPARSDD